MDHKVEVHTVGGFFSAWTGFDPFEEWGPAEWLCVPQQRLLEVTAGRVYHDGIGELQEARARLRYYPRDVWLYLLAAQWGSRRRSSGGRARRVTNWEEQEGRLSEAYGIVARMHNALGLTPPLATGVSRYHDRPYLVVHSGRFAAALEGAIQDQTVLSVPHRAGSIDQICDSTDVLSRPEAYLKLKGFFE